MAHFRDWPVYVTKSSCGSLWRSTWKHGLVGREATSYTARERHQPAWTHASAYAKLPKSSCSRQRWHRHVRASSRCLASTTWESADQKQKWVYQLLCRALRRCSKHYHVITSSDHTSVRLLRPSQEETAATSDSDPEPRELFERAGESLELWNKVEADMKTFVLSQVYMSTWERMCYLCTGHVSRWQKHWRKEHSPPPLWLHTESSFGKDKRHNILTDPYDLFFSYWYVLGIHEWELPTSSSHSAAVTSSGHTSWLHRWQQQWEQLQLPIGYTIVTTTVTFLTQPI